MRIAFCTPFKPLNNHRPSGDVTIPADLCRALESFGNHITHLPFLPCKEIWEEAERMAGLKDHLAIATEAARGCDCLLTYGSYYKVPDAVGHRVATRLGIPYFLFQASYAPSHANDPHAWPGFLLNELAMLSAEYIFCNSPDLEEGCAKLLPSDRFGSISPGFNAEFFSHDENERERLRTQWGTGNATVIGCAAMMRPGVKSHGIRWLIDTVADIRERGNKAFLAVAGGGDNQEECRQFAESRLGSGFIFTDTLDRTSLPGFFSALDVFAFPGLRESIGMSYLEAQACGVPCVGTDDLGVPRVVSHAKTGLVVPAEYEAFSKAVERLANDRALRETMGAAATREVKARFDARRVYRKVETIMRERSA